MPMPLYWASFALRTMLLAMCRSCTVAFVTRDCKTPTSATRSNLVAVIHNRPPSMLRSSVSQKASRDRDWSEPRWPKSRPFMLSMNSCWSMAYPSPVRLHRHPQCAKGSFWIEIFPNRPQRNLYWFSRKSSVPVTARSSTCVVIKAVSPVGLFQSHRFSSKDDCDPPEVSRASCKQSCQANGASSSP